MKHLLLTTIAAVVLVGCGESQQSAPAPESKPVEPVAEAATPEPPTAKTPNISILNAAAKGNIDAIKQHLAAGTDVNVKDDFGRTPLDYAKDYPETTDLLRTHGGKSGAEDSIHTAAMMGNIEAVKQHLAAGTDVNAKDVIKWTPLYRATNKETAELLIAEGADVNAKGDLGETPLHHAAGSGRTEVAELLIAEGADVNAKDKFGQTPLDKASSWKRTEIVDLLRKHGGKTKKELKAAGN